MFDADSLALIIAALDGHDGIAHGHNGWEVTAGDDVAILAQGTTATVRDIARATPAVLTAAEKVLGLAAGALSASMVADVLREQLTIARTLEDDEEEP